MLYSSDCWVGVGADLSQRQDAIGEVVCPVQCEFALQSCVETEVGLANCSARMRRRSS